MTQPTIQRKLTILFPPGDVLTSVLYEKEKDSKIGTLLNRLCQMRGLNLPELRVLGETGDKIDLEKTVAEANLMFVELVDKHAKKSKEKKKDEDTEKVTMQKGVPQNVKIVPGKFNTYSLKEQLFPHEWQALQDMKTNYEVCKMYSDEFVMACLFSRKLDLVRAHTLLQGNLKWRKENNFVNIPKMSEVNMDVMKIYNLGVGTRSKEGTGILYMEVGDMEIGKEPYTITTMMKWISWYNYVGIFSEGMDIFRNGTTFVEDLDGLGWKHMDLEFQKKMGAVWQDTFPMRVKKILVLNPPGIFEAISKIMRTIMKGKIMDRFEITSAKDLPKFIDKENLLAKFGGKFNMTQDQSIALLKEFCEKYEEGLAAPGRESQ